MYPSIKELKTRSEKLSKMKEEFFKSEKDLAHKVQMIEAEEEAIVKLMTLLGGK